MLWAIIAYIPFGLLVPVYGGIMPGKNGLEATKEITEYDSSANIIMVSALGQQSKVFEAIAAGAKDFVVKPFEPDKIIECIAKYV